MTVSTGPSLVLKNAHVIDPQSSVDRIADVVIEGGRIRSVGDAPISIDGEESSSM